MHFYSNFIQRLAQIIFVQKLRSPDFIQRIHPWKLPPEFSPTYVQFSFEFHSKVHASNFHSKVIPPGFHSCFARLKFPLGFQSNVLCTFIQISFKDWRKSFSFKSYTFCGFHSKNIFVETPAGILPNSYPIFVQISFEGSRKSFSFKFSPAALHPSFTFDQHPARYRACVSQIFVQISFKDASIFSFKSHSV